MSRQAGCRLTALRALFAGASCIFCAGAHAEASYDLVLLIPPGGKTANISNQVNAGGTVVGVHAPWNGGAPDANGMMPYQPALYAGGKLAPVTHTLGGTTTVAYVINAAGHIAGCSSDASGRMHAYLYAAGRMQDLGTLGHARSCAGFVNDRDEVVGNATDDSGNVKSHPFIFRNGRMRDLNELLAPDTKLFQGQKYVLTGAYCINNRGDMLLQARAEDGRIATVLYAGGKLTLPDPDFQSAHRAAPAMLARLTNGLEFVANERNADFSMAQAYLYRAGRYQAISPPQAGGKFEAYDLNAQGTVVGSALSHMDGPQLKGSVAAAFIDGQMLDLNTAVDPGRLTVDGKQYKLKMATGINDGGTIVGEATLADDPAQGATFILTPRAPGQHLDAAAMGKALQDRGAVDIYDILFDSGKTGIKSESRPTLEQIASLLKGDPALTLEVSGHTDNQGNAKRNLALSTSRAQAVVQTLVTQYGIAAARLQAAGYGDTKPMAPNDSESGRAKNRRVELRKMN
jgi:probable HAF family extracellular repeat protein